MENRTFYRIISIVRKFVQIHIMPDIYQEWFGECAMEWGNYGTNDWTFSYPWSEVYRFGCGKCYIRHKQTLLNAWHDMLNFWNALIQMCTAAEWMRNDRHYDNIDIELLFFVWILWNWNVYYVQKNSPNLNVKVYLISQRCEWIEAAIFQF